jgi:hypothetical protein
MSVRRIFCSNPTCTGTTTGSFRCESCGRHVCLACHMHKYCSGCEVDAHEEHERRMGR